MNKEDWKELAPDDRKVLDEAWGKLGIEVIPTPTVPRGYVRHQRTGTIYKLDTWLEKVRLGLVRHHQGEVGE